MNKTTVKSQTIALSIASVVASMLAGTSCRDSFMKSKVRSKTTALVDLTTSVDAAGNVSAAFDPGSSRVQVLRITSGTLAGAGVALPPGALSIPVSITVGEGETLASSSFTQSLGITGNNITAAGPSVSFIPSTNVEASSPFTLSIPVSSTSLALSASSSENLIVMYRWMKVDGDAVSYQMGLIPKSDVIVTNEKVSFQTTKFGVFQIGVSDVKISEKVTKDTVEPPALKGDASNPLVGSWAKCHDDGDYSKYDSTTSTTTNTGPVIIFEDRSTTTAITSASCSTAYYMNFALPVRIFDNQTYTVAASMDGGTLYTNYSAPLTGPQDSASPVVLYDQFISPTGPVGKTFNFQAPAGCFFEEVVNGVIHRFSTYGATAENLSLVSTKCSFTSPTTALICGAPPPPNTTTTSSQPTPHYGDDGLGRVPGSRYSFYDIAKFTAKSFIHIKKTFKSADCTGSLISSITETGNYELPPVDVPGTMPINFTFGTKVGSLFDPDGIAAANKDPDFLGCGLADWVAGVDKDLTHTRCSMDRDTEYSRILISGKKMFFCDENDSGNKGDYGNTPANRVPNCETLKQDKSLDRQ